MGGLNSRFPSFMLQQDILRQIVFIGYFCSNMLLPKIYSTCMLHLILIIGSVIFWSFLNGKLKRMCSIYV